MIAIGTHLGGTFSKAAMASAILVSTAMLTVGEAVELTTETQQCLGTLTGHTVDYTVVYPTNQTNLPVFLHQYGQISQSTGVDKVNERVAGYGAFSVFVSLADSHCGYELQDYKDAIDDAFTRYAGKINTKNVTIAGESYGGAVTYGMATRFPYLFDAVIPIFGIADFGYDDTQSWYVMTNENSPSWGVANNMNTHIGDRAKYRDTRYLVRNAVFAAKNNPYAHFEMLHDADDGVGKTGVQVQNSRRYAAELNRLGYTNYRYTETPNADVVYPSDSNFASSLWGQQVRYTHGFWDTGNTSLYEFELDTLKPNMLSGVWKRTDFATTGDLFVPSFLEVPRFRFDLGNITNNCDEAADVIYDVSSAEKYTFEITPRTALTEGTLQLHDLTANSVYHVTWTLADAERLLSTDTLETDAYGKLVSDIPSAALGSTLVINVWTVPEPGSIALLMTGSLGVLAYVWRNHSKKNYEVLK